jgi:hypothetical protein
MWNQRVLNDLKRARLSRDRMIWLLAHSFPPSLVSYLDQRHTGRMRKRDNLLLGEGEEGGGQGAVSYGRKKALFSLNHLILSAQNYWSAKEDVIYGHSPVTVVSATKATFFNMYRA